jgi:hypothetical protein
MAAIKRELEPWLLATRGADLRLGGQDHGSDQGRGSGGGGRGHGVDLGE